MGAALRRRWPVVVVALVLVAGAGLWIGRNAGSGPPPPCPPPPAPAAGSPSGSSAGSPAAGPVDLAGWKLRLPVGGTDADSAAVVEPAAVTAPWLTRTPTGGLLFWAPTTGATTKNSQHPRSELNSLTDFVAGSGRHTLSASVTVRKEPADGEGVIVGQIHGAGPISSVPYVMVRYQGHRLSVMIKQAREGDQHVTLLLLGGLTVNTPFTYSIVDSGDGCLAFTATRDGFAKAVATPLPAAFARQPVRFQAGSYQQSLDPGGPDDGALVLFDRLEERSAPR